MYHTKKSGGSPVTLEMIAFKAQSNKALHGKPVWWLEEGKVEELFFDRPSGKFLSRSEFLKVKRERAEGRRLTYFNGRKSVRGRRSHSFVQQVAEAPSATS